jgi:hypothetical protein
MENQKTSRGMEMDPKGNFKAPQGATHWYKANGLFYRFADDGNACFDRAHGYQPTGRNLDFYAEGSMLPLVEVMIAPQSNEPKNVAQLYWDGEGLPPVGAECEYRVLNGPWYRCEVGYSFFDGEHRCFVIKCPHLEYEQVSRIEPGSEGSIEFRPVRTPEQIAQQERQAAIEEMDAVFSSNFEGHRKDGLQALYDAGYRKP